MFNKVIYLFFVLSISSYSFAGDLQGGGGGRINSGIKRYLDKRTYGLDGARTVVAQSIILVNACIDGDTVHTIEPVWQCKPAADGSHIRKSISSCDEKVKIQARRKIRPAQKICEVKEKRFVDGKAKNVCVKFSKDKVSSFKTRYQLDVYKLNIGQGGSALYPKRDVDMFLKTIDYNIPTCSELNIR